MAEWKAVLDQWFSRTRLGRAAVFPKVDSRSLTASIRRNNTLPAFSFWKQALENFRRINFLREAITREGTQGQGSTIWHDLFHKHGLPLPATPCLPIKR
eukprot:scaffold249790_cov22-Tisochrysis_lutea.AAC.3